MKYCTHCGAEMMDEAVCCVRCGCAAEQQPKRDETLNTVIKVFLVLGCISVGWAIIPLAWAIPITVSIFRKLDAGEPIGVGLKIAALILVSRVAGICSLCQD